MNTHCCSGALPAAGLSRRAVLGRFGLGLGGIALADLVNPLRAGAATPQPAPGVLGTNLHFPATAKRVIYLFMAGGPSQIETFDDKPVLRTRNGEALPDSVRKGQRLTGMSGNQSVLPLAGSQFGFSQHGQQGTWVSDLLPHTARIVDDLCVVRSMYTEAINHDPAITFFQTGSQIAGRPSMGAWVHYGLGSDTQDLPAFVVLITPGKVDQPLYCAVVGQRLPAVRAPGRAVSQRQGRRVVPGQPGRRHAAEPAAAARSTARPARLHCRTPRRRRRRRAHRAVRDVVPHAGQRAWRDGRVQ